MAKRTTILASGDHHFFEAGPRFGECIRVHSWMVDLARERKVDLFLSAGDVYERESNPRERDAVSDWIRSMTEVCPFLLTKWNHDRHLDCAILAKLATKCPVIVQESAGSIVINRVAVAMMAWPERAALLAAAGSQEGADSLVREALQHVLRGLGDQVAAFPDHPRILLSHSMIDGSVVSTGQPLLGMPVNVGLADLALSRATLGIHGHIHRAQRFDVAGAPHYYTGSPFRTDFGQLEKKTVLLATFDGAELVEVEEIETPATKMIHVDDEWGTGNDAPGLDLPPCFSGWLVGDGKPDEWRGVELRFRYRVAVDRREEARRGAEIWKAHAMARYGAASVKVEEEVITERRARAPNVSRETTLAGKLAAHWESVKFEPGERREALLAKAAKTEEEDRHAA